MSQMEPGSLTSASSFPPPNPTHPGGSVSSHPCPAGSQAISSTFPRGRSAPPQQLVGRREGSCFAAEGEGREVLQLAEKYAYEREIWQAAEKALLAACAPHPCCLPPGTAQLLTLEAEGSPLRFPAPAHRLPSACRAGPRAHGFKEAGSWHRHCSELAGCTS